MNQQQTEARLNLKDELRRMEKRTQDSVCSVCGSLLVMPYDGSKIILTCSKDRSHVGYVKQNPALERYHNTRQSMVERGESTEAIDKEIQEFLIYEELRKGRRIAKAMAANTDIAKYQEVAIITKTNATDILRTVWPKAPEHEILKAALLCASKQLNPLMKHVFLIQFGNDWVTVLGIKATRLLAARQKALSYVDGPRVMTDDEQKAIFGEVDPALLRAIVKVKDKEGNVYPGYGHWLKSQNPYGSDKGNSKANMAFIRAERSALDKACPGALPADFETIDETFTPEIKITNPSEESAAPRLAESTTTEPTASKQPKTTAASRKRGTDPIAFVPKNQADLVGAANYFFGKSVQDLSLLLENERPEGELECSAAWQKVLKAWHKPDDGQQDKIPF